MKLNAVFFLRLREIWASLRKIWPKWCFDLKNAPKMKLNAVFFMRSISLEFFSGKFGEIWAKYFAPPKICLL